MNQILPQPPKKSSPNHSQEVIELQHHLLKLLKQQNFSTDKARKTLLLLREAVVLEKQGLIKL